MRVYLPTTLARLRDFVETRSVGPAGAPAHAVTPMLREMYLGDGEELEYLAQLHAATACLRLLREDPDAPSLRVVLALELPPGAVTAVDDAGPGSVVLTEPQSWDRVAAGLVDDPEASPAVRAAVLALPAADAGDDDARFLIDEAAAHELGWWATQELPDLL